MKEKGFTLIELVLIIGLLVLTAGVSSDIIITLIRSYNKTQVTNEIEQSADFVILKLEKELRNAQEGTVAISQVSPIHTLSFTNATNQSVIYKVDTGAKAISRSVDAGANYVLLTDPDYLRGGVAISCPNGVCFYKVAAGDVEVVRVTITFSQTGSSGSVSITGSVPIESTIVVRASQ